MCVVVVAVFVGGGEFVVVVVVVFVVVVVVVVVNVVVAFIVDVGSGVVFAVDVTTAGEVCMDRVDVVGGIVVVNIIVVTVVVVVVVATVVDAGSGVVFTVVDAIAGDVRMDRVDVDGGTVVVVVVVVVVVNFVDVSLGVVKWEAPKSVILTRTHRFSSNPPTLYIPLKISNELLYSRTLNIQFSKGRLNTLFPEKMRFQRKPNFVGVEGRWYTLGFLTLSIVRYSPGLNLLASKIILSATFILPHIRNPSKHFSGW